MAGSEHEYISLCKNQIEEKFAFGNGHGFTQKDLEILSVNIFEKTGVAISLSTLKRFWKGDFKQSPQIATLNALAEILEYKDWQEFKQRNRLDPGTKNPKVSLWASAVILTTVFLVLAGAYFIKDEKKTRKPPVIKGPVYFDVAKTVVAGIPNTVIFKFDLSKVSAESFSIQQSWNWDIRAVINPLDSIATSIYYESGFHRAKLIANDSIIATRPIHILSNGWEPHLYKSDSEPELIDLKNEQFIMNGQLQIDSSLLNRRKVEYSENLHTRISNSQVFDLHSDNFSFSTRMKANRLAHHLCAWMDLIIVTEARNFGVSFTEKGCEKNAGYRIGEIPKSGKNNDMTALGCNVYEWQDLELRVINKEATIYLNSKPVFKEGFTDDAGKIVALIYIFDGVGSIDFASLKNGEGEVIFEDTFEK